MANADVQPSVRFAAENEEIEPPQDVDRAELPEQVQQELKSLSLGIQKSRLQEHRMQNFAFEPVSLPPSRAPSPSGSRNHSRAGSRHNSSATSPFASPALRGQHGHSPPLTPAATQGKPVPRSGSSGTIPKVAIDASNLTPQISGGGAAKETGRKSLPTSRHGSRHGSRASSPSGRSSTAKFSLGSASSGVTSESRDTSPSRDSKHDDAKSKRKSQISAFDSLETKFKQFGTGKRSSGFGSSSRNGSVVDVKEAAKESSSGGSSSSSHHHGLFGGRHKHEEEGGTKHSGSMHDLKRFFKFGGGHKPKSEHSSSHKSSRSGAVTPPSSKLSQPTNIPFSDDHTLEAKYGKFGKVLGSGAGGSVRLMKRSSDGVTFAVKQFRPRHSYESEKEYNKKVTAEFCVGSTLHHGNIIETMDIIHEHGSWYEVMEYAPFDLFAIVMTGKMSKPEVTCCFLQIVAGVSYLHGMGLAHRDLKLDNVVVNEFGIMKLIDFGSAVVFQYPFEKDIVKASGIVGSDPYLAPEVYDESKYDPRAVDIWSLAIIYCCMSLRRFPWKLPRLTDTSYKYFVADPTPGTPSVDSLRKRSIAIAQDKGSAPGVQADGAADGQVEPTDSNNASNGGHRASASEMGKVADSRPETPDQQEQKAPQTIKGPWRLLRLLPRDSRYIIGRMLDTDPKSRATLAEVQGDSWISTQPVCKQEPGGKVIRAKGHEHVLEPGAGASATAAAPAAKK